MADDLNKKILITVDVDTTDVTKNIINLNKVIDSLLTQQKQLDTAGSQNSATFEGISVKLEAFQKKLEEVKGKLAENTKAANELSEANKKIGASVRSSADALQKNAMATANATVKTKELITQVSASNQSIKQQQTSLTGSKGAMDGYAVSVAKGSSTSNQLVSTLKETTVEISKQAGAVKDNKTEFDGHKVTMEHLKKSFDEIKDVSGIFGPSLNEAAKGFGVMKSGLKLVQDGFTGVGTAIKADGFEFLLEILQMMFDYFVKSSDGSKILKGAISAIGVVVNEVKAVFSSFMNGIINAFSHPIDSLKSLGKMIEQNLINRFSAFGVILDGIIHLDFKKISNGAIQAATGISNATDKIKETFDAVKNGVVETGKKMVESYKNGYSEAAKQVSTHEDKVMASINTQINGYRQLKIAAGQANNEQRYDTLTLENPKSENSIGGTSTTNNHSNSSQTIGQIQLVGTQKTEDAKREIVQNSYKTIEDYARQSSDKLAKNAIGALSKSIEQQSAAKIASLESDKTKELSNKSLTAAQKLAIEAKYKKQEGAIKAKAFKEQQELSIAQALINGAEAVTKVWAQGGILGAIETGVVIAETALQIEKIAAQKPPAYANGGLHYTSDGRGGVLTGYSRTDNTNAYLRSGEGVVVSEAMQVPWARNLVSEINVGFGGRDFSTASPGRGYAVGGIFTDGGDANRYYNQPVNDQKNLANTIAYQMINNFPPVYVDVKDVNTQQNILAQTVNRVNL